MENYENFNPELLSIRALGEREPAPMDLLLLADPALAEVEWYLKRGTCYVGEYEGRIVGEYVILPTRPFTMEIMNIAVLEEFQGNGIGAALLRHAETTAREAGCRSLLIGTGNAGIGQLALYQKSGFRISGIYPDFFPKHYPEEIWENGILCRDMIRLYKELENN